MDYLPVYAGGDEDRSIVKVAPGKLQRTGVRSEVVSHRAIVRQGGFIALAGVAAETGVVMLIYLEQAMTEVRNQCEQEARKFTRIDLHPAVMLGAVERVRPKMMTVVAIIAGLVPILWSTGTGSEVMQRIAVPMIGGMMSSTLLTLVVIPAIYGFVKGWRLPMNASRNSEEEEISSLQEVAE